MKAPPHPIHALIFDRLEEDENGVPTLSDVATLEIADYLAAISNRRERDEVIETFASVVLYLSSLGHAATAEKLWHLLEKILPPSDAEARYTDAATAANPKPQRFLRESKVVPNLLAAPPVGSVTARSLGQSVAAKVDRRHGGKIILR